MARPMKSRPTRWEPLKPSGWIAASSDGRRTLVGEIVILKLSQLRDEITAMSKLEDELGRDLALMARRENDPWPMYEREMHPFWCCEHRKRQHAWIAGTEPRCVACEVDGRYRPSYHGYQHKRDFRVDFAYPFEGVAVEVEGVNWGVQGGRHQTGAGFTKDLEKYSMLELAGWKVIRVGAKQIKDGTALALIERALEAK